MNVVTGQDLILACSAIGAGLAVIAGIGPGIDRVSQQDMRSQPLVETQAQKVISCLPCF